MEKKQKFLFVLTSHGELGSSGDQTGFHFSEMSDPYYILQDHGLIVDLASIEGGQPPADPLSLEKKPESVNRFLADSEAMDKLENTIAIGDIEPSDYCGLYLPGGHGTMWDFPDSQALQKVVGTLWKAKKIVAAVCHGPAGLLNVTDEKGDPIIKNRRLNSFTDEEERKVGKEKIVPFLLETALRKQGALFESVSPFQATVVEDSHLITGQNPPSASLVANAVLRALGISPYENHKIQAA